MSSQKTMLMYSYVELEIMGMATIHLMLLRQRHGIIYIATAYPLDMIFWVHE